MTLREAKRQAAGRNALAQAMRMVAELIETVPEPPELLDQLHALQERLSAVEDCVGVSTPATLFDAG